jgi:type IV pilus assembly protein PilP
MSKNCRKKYSFIAPKTLCTALIVSGLVWSHTAWAVKNNGEGGQSPETTVVSPEEYSEKVKELVQFLKGETDPFVYTREGRSDPFMPFVSEKVVQKDEEAEKEELTGMRAFEPGQLQLTAIIMTAAAPIAMVQDAVGIGYVLREGDELGRSGVVNKISKNLVVIKQKYMNTAGDEKYRLVEMLLKKEGEQ